MQPIKNQEKLEGPGFAISPDGRQSIGRPEQRLDKQESANTSESAVVSEVPSQSLPSASAVGHELVGTNKRQKEIEDVLASDLLELYRELPGAKQQEFKLVGEKTAAQINILLSESKIKVEKIINLIKSWLSLLPGVNKYFLEKEAKIKADALIQLRKGGEQ